MLPVPVSSRPISAARPYRFSSSSNKLQNGSLFCLAIPGTSSTMAIRIFLLAFVKSTIRDLQGCDIVERGNFQTCNVSVKIFTSLNAIQFFPMGSTFSAWTSSPSASGAIAFKCRGFCCCRPSSSCPRAKSGGRSARGSCWCHSRPLHSEIHLFG